MRDPGFTFDWDPGSYNPTPRQRGTRYIFIRHQKVLLVVLVSRKQTLISKYVHISLDLVDLEGVKGRKERANLRTTTRFILILKEKISCNSMLYLQEVHYIAMVNGKVLMTNK